MANYRTVTATAVLSDRVIRAKASITNMTLKAKASLATPVAYSPIPHYGGTYTVTPSAEGQTIPTSGMVMDGDVLIAPIPQNYGLITWDGTKLTVS